MGKKQTNKQKPCTYMKEKMYLFIYLKYTIIEENKKGQTLSCLCCISFADAQY